MAALRIASLVPSLTELIVELGLRDCLVARTGYCIHPSDAIRDVPKVGGTKDVNLAKLRRLAPTHVLVNVDENRRDIVDAMRAWPSAPQIVVTHPGRAEDNLELYAQMATLFADRPGVTERAASLSHAMQEELALTRPATRAPQPVLYLIWREPWMTVARDTYISRLLGRVDWQTHPDTCGGATGAARYPKLDGTEPWLADIRQVLLSSEPYPFEARHLDEARALCPNAEARLVDGEMLSWYGSRAIAGLRYLRALADAARG